MATRSINTSLKMDGEKEYKQAISSINDALRVMGSEMKKVTAEYQDNSKSVDALKAKGDVLERTLLTQKEKVEELRKALQASAKELGESHKDTMKWQESLNKAEADVANTEHAIRENNDAIEQATQDLKDNDDQTKKNGASLTDLADKFGVKLPDGAKKALDGIGNFSVGSVAAIGAVVAIVKETIDAVKKLIEITDEVAVHVDDLNTLATTSGLDTYTLQVLTYMEDLADVKMDTVTDAAKELTKSISSAAEGGEDALAVFNTLGVAVTENGHMREASDVLWDVVDALGAMEAGTERDALASKILGENAKNLNTLVAVGSEGFRDFAAEAEEVGYILSEKDMKALQAYNDTLDKNKKLNDAIHEQMAAKMAPGLQELQEGWQNLKSEGLQLIIDSKIIDFLSKLCDAIGTVIGFVGDMMEVLNALLHPLNSLRELFGIQTQTLQENASVTNAATQANEQYKASVQGDAGVLNSTTNAANQATAAINAYKTATASMTGAQRALAEAYGVTVNEAGTRWYDPWGHAHTADEDVYDVLYGGYNNGLQFYNADGSEFRYNINSNLPGVNTWNASGDMNFVGGPTWLGENGPELAVLPRGTQIMNAQDSRNVGGDVYYITIDAKSVQELNDIVRIVQNTKTAARRRA